MNLILLHHHQDQNLVLPALIPSATKMMVFVKEATRDVLERTSLNAKISDKRLIATGLSVTVPWPNLVYTWQSEMVNASPKRVVCTVPKELKCALCNPCLHAHLTLLPALVLLLAPDHPLS